jgi:hypothetical protein
VDSPGVVGISDVPWSEEEATPLIGTRLQPDQRAERVIVANNGKKMVPDALSEKVSLIGKASVKG